MNKNKAAAIIEGPEGVLNSNEENNPMITDNTVSYTHLTLPTTPYV